MAQADFETLFGVLVPFAKQMLREHGEFFPFAASIDQAGEITQAAADTGTDQPDSSEVVALLAAGLRVQAVQGTIRACGICLNVGARLPGYGEKTDAICCQMESADGQATQLFVPYRKRFFGRFKFDAPVGLAGELRVFGAQL